MKLIKTLLICTSLLAIGSCDDMNSIHQEYLDMPEINYLSIPKEVITYGGKGRIKLEWLLSADPNVAFCRIYWNSKNDSLDYPIKRTEEFESCIIEIEEGNYNFELVHMDAEGQNRSLSRETSGRSYGELYAATLVARPLTMVLENGHVKITWRNVENCKGCNFTYIKSNGDPITIQVDADATETLITDYKSGSEYSYTTLYEPEPDAIDVMESLPTTGVLPE